MSNWTPYPDQDKGEWKTMDGLILTARYNGAWSVHDPMGEMGSRASSLANIMAPGIEQAKAGAERAANELLNEAEQRHNG